MLKKIISKLYNRFCSEERNRINKALIEQTTIDCAKKSRENKEEGDAERLRLTQALVGAVKRDFISVEQMNESDQAAYYQGCKDIVDLKAFSITLDSFIEPYVHMILVEANSPDQDRLSRLAIDVLLKLEDEFKKNAQLAEKEKETIEDQYSVV